MTPTYVARVGARGHLLPPVVLRPALQPVAVLEPTHAGRGRTATGQPSRSSATRRQRGPRQRRWRHQARHVQRAELLPDLRRRSTSRSPGTTPARTSTTVPGNPITVNDCGANGPRGAASRPTCSRQQDKIVSAINTLDADVVSLEEIENSVQFGETGRRDQPAGRRAERRRRRRAPGPTSRPGRGRPAADRRAGRHPHRLHLQAGHGQPWWAPPRCIVRHARRSTTPASRWPGLQAGRRPATPTPSRSSSTTSSPRARGRRRRRTGQGTPTPTASPGHTRWRPFADQFKADAGTNKVFLVGDFNAYTQEDPIQVLEQRATPTIDSRSDPHERVLLQLRRRGPARSTTSWPTPAALSVVTGADVWDINADESVSLRVQPVQLQRHQLLRRRTRSGASDHDPVIVGINAPSAPTRDHPDARHQRLPRPDLSERRQSDGRRRGAGRCGQAAARRRTRNTVFAAAGDLIGASTFESFIAARQADHRRAQRGRPGGLGGGQPRVRPGLRRPGQPGDGSLRRQHQPATAVRRLAVPRGATSRNTDDGLDPSRRDLDQDFGGVKVGFIGAVTEHLPRWSRRPGSRTSSRPRSCPL